MPAAAGAVHTNRAATPAGNATFSALRYRKTCREDTPKNSGIDPKTAAAR